MSKLKIYQKKNMINRMATISTQSSSLLLLFMLSSSLQNIFLLSILILPNGIESIDVMSIIKAWIELRSFASKHVNNTKPISIYKQLQLYPYKPVYGLPDNDCQQPAFRAEFDRCEEEQRKRWRITVDDYVSMCVIHLINFDF